jgi:hypothetical protein
MANAPPARPQPASDKIEFNYLNRNLMVPNIHLPTFAIGCNSEANNDASFVSRNE